MSRARTFKQSDLTAAIRAAKAAGLAIAKVEVGKDGKIVVIAGEPTKPEPDEDDINQQALAKLEQAEHERQAPRSTRNKTRPL